MVFLDIKSDTDKHANATRTFVQLGDVQAVFLPVECGLKL